MPLRFKIEICSAENLAKQHVLFGSPKPFVRLDLFSAANLKAPKQSFSTNVAGKKTNSPRWNETFEIELNSVKDTLDLSVFDRSKEDIKFLGHVLINSEFVEKYLEKGDTMVFLERSEDYKHVHVSGYLMIKLKEGSKIESTIPELVVSNSDSMPTINVEEIDADDSPSRSNSSLNQLPTISSGLSSFSIDSNPRSLTKKTSSSSLSPEFNRPEMTRSNSISDQIILPDLAKSNQSNRSSSSSLLKVPGGGLFNRSLSGSNQSLRSSKSDKNFRKSTEDIYRSLSRLELTDLGQKLNEFNKQIMNMGTEVVVIRIELSRANILEDSYCFLTKLKAKFARTRFLIKFKEEEGVDYGGVGKEWFHLLSHKIFSPKYGLFVVNQMNKQLEINVDSQVLVPNYKNAYKFIGQIMGLALYNSFHLDVSLANLIFKNLLDEPLSLDDLKYIDAEMYNSMNWLLENKLEKNDTYTFSLNHESLGQVETIDLIENGRNVSVNESNKRQYIAEYMKWRLKSSFQEQMDLISSGFYEIVPRSLVKIFDSNDLQLIICGLETIDIQSWKENSVYVNCSEKSAQVSWFWKAVDSLDQSKRKRLLQLVTGSTRLPIKEFNSMDNENLLPFTICLLPSTYSTNSLPIINTCFSRITLPCYESYDKLLAKLTLTIVETKEFSVQ